MKTTIDIAKDLLLRARRIAEKENITLRALAEEGLRLAIERREMKARVEIEPHVVTGKSPPGDLGWTRLRDVLYGKEGMEIRE